MGYPGIKKKNKSRGISRGLGIKSYLKLRRGVTHLGGADSGEALLCLEFPGIKAKDLQIQGVFKKICPQIPPSCFSFFFWNRSLLSIHKNIFACLVSIHNTISLSH